MKTIALVLDELTLERAQRLAKEQGCSLQDLLCRLIGRLEAEASQHDPLLGLLKSEPELTDRVAEEALAAREKARLREPSCGQDSP
ncbi:MAG: hypothetical protein HY721_27440 [Planctomycetes bacterium]|nr:hypothetical protein [Planctomycetota bacterium]